MYRRSLLQKQHLLALRPNGRRFNSSAIKARTKAKAIISIQNGTFYSNAIKSSSNNPNKTQTSSNPPLFKNLTFTLPPTPQQNWSIISPSSASRTAFLQILSGRHSCDPPNARSYPALTASPAQRIQYVGFDAERGSSVSSSSGSGGVRGAYLSARYESRREAGDFSLEAFLRGETELNALEKGRDVAREDLLARNVALLRLSGDLLRLPVANLSNGQTRRARIARALMAEPEVLLLDGLFMGLDPGSVERLGHVLGGLAESGRSRVVVSLRPEDGVPDWITHCVVVDGMGNVLGMGEKENVLAEVEKKGAAGKEIVEAVRRGHAVDDAKKMSRDGFSKTSPALPPGEALVEISGAKVAYGSTIVLGDWESTTKDDSTQPRVGLHWSLHRGQRSGIFGPNGSGKTTMLSLITSDHPQTYSQPVRLFGRSRLAGPGEAGISLFDIQARMGHSSPEVHAFFPKILSVRRALQSAWADAPMAKPRLGDDGAAEQRVDACLRWFARELRPTTVAGADDATVLELLEDVFTGEAGSGGLVHQIKAVREVYNELRSSGNDLIWADELRFGELSFSGQRLMLFLHAIVKGPDLVILDEALSGIDEATRDKALLFLSHGEKVSVVKDGTAVPSVLEKMGEVTFPGLSPDQALLVISHSREDVPGCVRDWICLPEPGEGRAPRTGTLDGPLELNPQGWQQIWGRS